jgi:hypothetical protein
MIPTATVTFSEHPLPEVVPTSLTLGPVTMTFAGRLDSPPRMIFHLACTAFNAWYSSPRIEVLFSSNDDGTGDVFTDFPGCTGPGTERDQIFPDLNTDEEGEFSRAFKLRVGNPPPPGGVETGWLPLEVTDPGEFGWAVTCSIEQATIRHGRDDAQSQPEASAVTFDVLGPLPEGTNIGTRARIDALLPNGAIFPRFVGIITDVALSWEALDRPVAQIIAVGELARMGNFQVGDAAPAELDGMRVRRAIEASGVSTHIPSLDPGAVHLAAHPAEWSDTLSIAHNVAETCAGMLWQTTAGHVLYADLTHRDGAFLDLTIDPCIIPLNLTWGKSLEGLVNEMRITYAPGGSSAELIMPNPYSIGRYGTFSQSLSTEIDNEDDAVAVALVILEKQSEPFWRIAGLELDLALIANVGSVHNELDDMAMTMDVLFLEVHKLVAVLEQPYAAPRDQTYQFIEGWTETITHDSWTIAFSVSDYCATAATDAWDEVDGTWTWNTAYDAVTTWNDMPCTPPVSVTP